MLVLGLFLAWRESVTTTSFGVMALLGFSNSAFENEIVVKSKISILIIFFILKIIYSEVLYLLLFIINTKNIGRINVKSVTTINKIPSSE